GRRLQGVLVATVGIGLVRVRRDGDGEPRGRRHRVEADGIRLALVVESTSQRYQQSQWDVLVRRQRRDVLAGGRGKDGADPIVGQEQLPVRGGTSGVALCDLHGGAAALVGEQ